MCGAVNPNYHQTKFGGGIYDGFIASFDISDNSLIYSTYFGGGNENDHIVDIISSGSRVEYDGTPNDPAESEESFFYICGWTNVGSSQISSTHSSPLTAYTNGNFPLSDPQGSSYFMDSPEGQSGFIAYFENYELKWSTLIGGNESDGIYNLELKPGGDLYALGETNSDTKSSCNYNNGDMIPICDLNGVSYQSGQAASTSSELLYIARFSPAHQFKWATAYGEIATDESIDEVVGDIETGLGGKLFVLGESLRSGSAGFFNKDIETKSQGNFYFQNRNLPSGSGLNDPFILLFNDDNQLQWATYLGGENEDSPTEMEYKDLNLRIVGFTFSDNNTKYPQRKLGGAVDIHSVPINSTNFNLNGFISEFNFTMSFMLGENQYLDPNSTLHLYPNPSRSIVYLQIESKSYKNSLIEVITSDGKILISNSEVLVPGSNTVKIDVSSLSKGLYLIKLLDPESRLKNTLRFVKE